MKARQLTILLAASALLGAAAPFARADVKLGQERFFGKGTRGPYSISRQAVEPRTETVRLNGRHLVKGQDYLFDAGMGALAFTEPVRLSDTVEVDYQYDTATAHAPTAAGGTLGLFSGLKGGLALSYTFKPDATGNQTLANLGFTGAADVAGSAMSAAFMVDKMAGANAGRDAQNMLLTMKRDTGSFKYDLGYSRVGLKFGQADAMKLLKGSEALNFNGSLQLSQNGALTLKRVQTSTPDAKTKVVKELDLLSGALNLNLSARTRFTALHEKQTEGQGKDNKTSAIDRLQLDQKMGRNAAATLVNEIVTAGVNGKNETTKATRLSLVASGANALNVESSLAVTNSSKAGDARDVALKLTQGAGATKVAMSITDRRADTGNLRTHSLTVNSMQGKSLRLMAGIAGESGTKGTHEQTSLGLEGGSSDRLRYAMGITNDTGTKKGTGTKFSLSSAMANGLSLNAFRSDDRTVKNGASSTKLGMDYTGSKILKVSGSMLENNNGTTTSGNTRFNLEATPSEDLKLVATRATDNTDKGDTSATKVNVNANAGANVKIAANYVGADDGKVSKEASGVIIEAAPSSALKLIANVGTKSDEKGPGQSKGMSLQANPSETIQVALSQADSTDGTGTSSIKQASVNLGTVKDRLSIGGAFSNETKRDKSEIQIAMLRADIRPMSVLAVSGYYKQRDTGSADQINTLNASITLKPAEALQVVGTYSANPEEKDQIIRLVRKGLALQTKAGGLTFSGGYIQESSLLDASEGTRAEFKLGLKLNKYAELQGGFQQTVGAVRGYKPILAYTVKYNHNIGSDFHLLLDADVTRRDDSVPVAQREEVKATANLGIRF